MRKTALALVLAATIAGSTGAGKAADDGCTPAASGAYFRAIERTLAAGRDVWGERLLASKNGPTLAAASHLLPPLLYAAGHGGSPLTATGVYYLPFTLPTSVGGPRGYGLHVADGSEIIVRRVGGPRLEVRVGAGELFGSCIARLRSPSLADGYLPILEVGYTDGAGARYREESFVGRLPGTASLVSFVRVVADRPADLRLVSARRTLAGRGEIEAAFLHAGARLLSLDAGRYATARAAVVAFWHEQLPPEPTFDVPEPRVVDAERALEAQELAMTWRYSVGNVYEELSYAEALDVAQVMAAYGYGDVSRQILRYTLRRLPARFTYWRAGERLVAGAQYFRLTGDARYTAEEAPGLRAIVDRLGRALGTSGLLPRERYSSDIPDEIYSLQGQTLVWQGLCAMSRVWARTGRPTLAREAARIAHRLAGGLRHAVRESERRLPDRSLFVPVRLLDGGAPFDRLTTSRDGTYWNLVVPYALASGFFKPRSRQSEGLLRYLLHHGSRLLGLVRAGAYRLAGSEPNVSGTDQVYGINVSRFLADDDQPDQLALSLYGTLSAALTPGTFVGGEAASVTPLRGRLYRTMYLPPNNDCAAAFLETLRLMLVHERRDVDGLPNGLELAFATPRLWLSGGQTVAVHDAPTSFGRLSYSIARRGRTIQATVTAPRAASLRLRLRLPAGERLGPVEVAGRPVPVDGATGTVDLTGRSGTFEVKAAVTAASLRS